MFSGLKTKSGLLVALFLVSCLPESRFFEQVKKYIEKPEKTKSFGVDRQID